MFARVTLLGAYLFLLVVLLPHTAWMFSLFEPEEMKGLGWAGAIAFEITIAVLTHFLAEKLSTVSEKKQSFSAKMKEELANIPAMLLMGSVVISVAANWTHAYRYASAVPYGEYIIVKVIYSILFGAALPVCSFAYAYVLSEVYRKSRKTAIAAKKGEDAAWMALTNYLRTNPGRTVTPPYLARLAQIDEETASKIIHEAVEAGIMANGKI